MDQWALQICSHFVYVSALCPCECVFDCVLCVCSCITACLLACMCVLAILGRPVKSERLFGMYT